MLLVTNIVVDTAEKEPSKVSRNRGWGPELGMDDLWNEIHQRLSPSGLIVLHLDPPEGEIWRARLAERGSRCDSPYFEQLAAHTGNLPVWSGTVRLSSAGSLAEVTQRALRALK